MQIYVNEKLVQVEDDATLFNVWKNFKADADVVIYNAFPVKTDLQLKPMDKVVLIKKGEIPSEQELEALMVSRHTPFVHEKIKNAKVGIAGLGGLGSNIAAALARMGIGKLVIVDFDVVDPSNLNRQNYFVRNIGMKKTEATKEILADCNPFVEVEAVDMFLDANNIPVIFKDVDIVVEAFDNAECKSEIVNTVLSKMKGKKIVSASGMAGYYSSNTIKTRKINNSFYLVGDLESEAKIGDGLMAARVGIAASHQANAVIRIIMDQGE